MVKFLDRQIKLLEIIINEYTQSALPLGSEYICDKYFKGYSSSTIRNDMALLEKHGLIEKKHTSGGRVPTQKGYEFYNKTILKSVVDNDLKNKLKKIFDKRELSIDTIVDQTVEILKETFKLPLIVSDGQIKSELLKRFDFIQLSEKKALIIIITSSSTILKNEIEFKNNTEFDDISTCIRVFNDRLIDTPISELSQKISSIEPIIRTSVHKYEYCLKQVIEKIFDFKTATIKTNVHGTSLLAVQPEFQDSKKLGKVLSFLEDTNIWKQIALTQSQKGKTTILFGKEFGVNELAIVNTSINSPNTNKQIAVVGPTRMQYSKVQGILDFIKEELENHEKI